MLTRRDTLIRAAGAAVVASAAQSAASRAQVAGANDRINVAVMGVRSRGEALVGSFATAQNCQVTALCDVDSRELTRISGEMVQRGLDQPKTDEDVRRILEDPDLDALVVAAPDHWHTPATLMALDAGKHVYLEKPCSYDPREGELLVAAQAESGKVVQMGNQQRSAPPTIALINALREGVIGDPYHVYTWYANNRGSIGNGAVTDAPYWLNWELWQGPAPRREYQDNLVHYNWHWFWHWGTGETCNNAAHELDVARWALGADFPERVEAHGSRRFFADDDWEMYDTLETRLTFPGGLTAVWEGHSCNNVRRFGRGRGALIYGTEGSAMVDRAGYQLFNRDGDAIDEVSGETSAADSRNLVGGGLLTDLHVANFLDAIRIGATQNSPIDEGHKSTLLCHLANIAYRTGETLVCDPATGRPQSEQAMSLWEREYEPGWEPRV